MTTKTHRKCNSI